MKNKKYYSYDDALKNLQKYCTYQDRCHKEVEQKLWDMNIYDEEDRGNIISQLIEDNYLNELRFAQSYVRGKYKLKRWGKKKIKNHLKQKEVSKYSIKKAFETEIDEGEYKNNLLYLLNKKNKQIKDDDEYKRKEKLTSFAVRKGYGYSFIKETLKEIL